MRTAEKQLKSNRCKFTEELKEAKVLSRQMIDKPSGRTVPTVKQHRDTGQELTTVPKIIQCLGTSISFLLSKCSIIYKDKRLAVAMGNSTNTLHTFFLFTEHINDHFLIHQQKHFYSKILTGCFLILNGKANQRHRTSSKQCNKNIPKHYQTCLNSS